jgi:glucose-1-phosphate thymidylyltransferase
VKGVVLAGGLGTRLYPLTRATSKQLMPVYDKPMVYYPLSVLMLAGIRDILLITTADDLPSFRRLLGDGSRFGIYLQYAIQNEPKGLAEAFIIGEKFIGDERSCLVLGDNIFYGSGFSGQLKNAASRDCGATIFGHSVRDPHRFGIVEIGRDGKPVSIEEKPEIPKSNIAVPGLYFYDSRVCGFAKEVKPGIGGELSITSINQMYLEDGDLNVEILGRGFTWFDTGTHDSLLEASHFVHSIEEKHGYKIACLEEIGYTNGWLSTQELLNQILAEKPCKYTNYLRSLLS